jgi:hypothetical protein
MFEPPNWTIIRIEKLLDTNKIHYFYNGKKFVYIGDELPTKVSRGFFIPVKKILWNGKDVTRYALRFAGPRQDFFERDVPLKYMFYIVTKVRWVYAPVVSNTRIGLEFRRCVHTEPVCGVLEIINIFNQSKSVASG